MRKWENNFNNVFTQGLSLSWADVLDQGCGVRETGIWKMGSQMEICQMERSWRTFKISTMEDLREEDRIEEKLNCKAVLM